MGFNSVFKGLILNLKQGSIQDV